MYIGSVIPSPTWHNCIWKCTVTSVESFSWIVLLLEKHIDSHVDLIGSVTFVKIFSKSNKHLYYVNSVTIVNIFVKDNIGHKNITKAFTYYFI